MTPLFCTDVTRPYGSASARHANERVQMAVVRFVRDDVARCVATDGAPIHWALVEDVLNEAFR